MFNIKILYWPYILFISLIKCKQYLSLIKTHFIYVMHIFSASLCHCLIPIEPNQYYCILIVTLRYNSCWLRVLLFPTFSDILFSVCNLLPLCLRLWTSRWSCWSHSLLRPLLCSLPSTLMPERSPAFAKSHRCHTHSFILGLQRFVDFVDKNR